MITWMKQHRKMTTIISVLLIVILLGGYWYNRSEKIHQAKKDIMFANQLLSKFHQQKTLHQKVGFLLHTLPTSNNKSLFCDYYYSIGYPDNGWRDAKPRSIDVALTIGKHENNDYEVICISPEYNKECILKIEDTSNDDKSYWIIVNNNWNIIDSGISNSERKIPKKTKDILLNISKKNMNLLFKTVEMNIQKYKKEAKLVLKKYHVS